MVAKGCGPSLNVAGHRGDRLSHEWLVRFIEHRIADGVVRLIQKWLNAGVLEDGKRIWTEAGSYSCSDVNWKTYRRLPARPTSRKPAASNIGTKPMKR